VPCSTFSPEGASARVCSSIVGGSSASLPQPKMPAFGGNANGSAPSNAASTIGAGSSAAACNGSSPVISAAAANSAV
jgi:hypothetical protein